MEIAHSFWMQRCLQLAVLGEGATAPNPMVGAVLVHEGRVIGEGYHRRFGEAHAEVNCVASVREEDYGLVRAATMYVSLEPCAHFGKTPPCTELIISHQIPRVVIGCEDPFAAVSGKGIVRLREAGVDVVTGVLETECMRLNRRFFTFHLRKRPYLILKWARSRDGFIALPGLRKVRISSVLTDRLVHRWRSEEAGILIGSHTAEYDDPALTTRLWTGPSPIRIVLDRSGRLPDYLRVFQGSTPTMVFTRDVQRRKGATEWLSVFPPQRFLEEVMGILHERQVLSVIVEGGAGVLEAFIRAGLWDEARIITGEGYLRDGLREPILEGGAPVKEFAVGSDLVRFFEHQS